MSNIKKFRIKSFKDPKPILKLEKISLKYGNKIILDNLDLKLNTGQILGILGPNGAGKSTIFNIILGLVKEDYGSIIINSKAVNEYPIYQRAKSFNLSICSQAGGYFHDMTVYENLKAVAEITINDVSYREEKINSLISKFELDSIRNLKAIQCSGGQQKRLSIAIALLSDPKILLLDEPYASLDILSIRALSEIIVSLQSKNNISIIITDHNATDLLKVVDTCAILNNGKIIAQDSPSKIINNIDARVYFGDSFKIS
tara:strand:- start:38094 stop:38867 length:774 start_codon:yes stop_codon:yes gene_type:complete